MWERATIHIDEAAIVYLATPEVNMNFRLPGYCRSELDPPKAAKDTQGAIGNEGTDLPHLVGLSDPLN